MKKNALYFSCFHRSREPGDVSLTGAYWAQVRDDCEKEAKENFPSFFFHFIAQMNRDCVCFRREHGRYAKMGDTAQCCPAVCYLLPVTVSQKHHGHRNMMVLSGGCGSKSMCCKRHVVTSRLVYISFGTHARSCSTISGPMIHGGLLLSDEYLATEYYLGRFGRSARIGSGRGSSQLGQDL